MKVFSSFDLGTWFSGKDQKDDFQKVLNKHLSSQYTGHTFGVKQLGQVNYPTSQKTSKKSQSNLANSGRLCDFKV